MSSLRFAFSNIAWTAAEEADVLPLLRDAGVRGIEVAPTAALGEWQSITPARARDHARHLADHGFEIPALQAILYGRPDARLFGTRGSTVLIEHLRTVAGLAEAFGARVAVLGAPGQRDRGERTCEQAMVESLPTLRAAAQAFHEHGCCLCIEPNPEAYGCNFITRAREAIELVRAVDHPGFGLHLDAGGLWLAGERLDEILHQALPMLRHFHISEPGLKGFAEPQAPHLENLGLLARAGFRGWCSVEMRRPPEPLRAVGPWRVLSAFRTEGCHG